MRLWAAVAANYHGRGISLQDLVQDGVVGLYDALIVLAGTKAGLRLMRAGGCACVSPNPSPTCLVWCVCRHVQAKRRL